MADYTVKQGDCLSSIARDHGFTRWRTIYDHANNAAFRQLRPDPNLIYPGDVLYIPDKEPKTDHGSTDDTHEYVLKREKTFLRMRILDCDRNPLAEKPYRLSVGLRTLYGVTDGQGFFEHEIRATDKAADLSVSLGDRGALEWSLELGFLDPVEEVTGVQARLNNLAFFCGSVDGIYGPKTKAAVLTFQETYRLLVDGIVGPQTRGELTARHGC